MGRPNAFASSAYAPVNDGVDAPPDGIDVPKWRC
jgi:hypothetical protein